MMDSSLTVKEAVVPKVQPEIGLARGIWLVAVQVVVLSLLVLALLKAGAPAKWHQALLGLLALGSLLVALVPSWRRGEAAAVLAGITLPIACWLAVKGGWYWETPDPEFAQIPKMIPCVAGSAVVLAVWGAICRAGLKDQPRYGVAAIIGALYLALFGSLLFFGVQRLPTLRALNYVLDLYLYKELIAVLLLYPAAVWLGTVGVRPAFRWTFLPLGMFLVIAGFLVFWKIGGRG